MKSINDASFPVPSLAAPEDMGDGLASSHWEVDLPQPAGRDSRISRITFTWLLFGSLLALAAIYHAALGEEAALAWSALVGSIALFLGAFLIHARLNLSNHGNIASQSTQSWLLLVGFIFPLAQLLLTLVLVQDNSVSALLLLLVLAYAAVVATPESLLHFLAVALFGWGACQLRMPAGAWLAFVIPWVVTALLALEIQKRFSHHRLVSLVVATPSLRVASSDMINVDTEQRLQAALQSQREAEMAHGAAQSALQQAKSDHDAGTQQWRQEREQLSQDLQNSQKQWKQALGQVKQLEERIETAQAELATARQESQTTDHWQKEAERWERQTHDAETEYDSLEADHHQLEEKLKAAQGELTALRTAVSTNANSESRMADLQTKLTAAEKSIGVIKQQLQQAENAKRQAEKDRQETETAWQQTEEELTRIRSELQRERQPKTEGMTHASEAFQPQPIPALGIGPRFFSGLTRTLETPLTALLEHADTLLDGITDGETRRQALVGLLRHGRNFRRLLTSAFDYAHLEAGSALINKVPCSPWQLVHDVVSEQRAVAEEKGLDIVIEPAGSLPRSITTDSDRCHRILRQLLHNALRFTSIGRITIRLALSDAPATAPALHRLRIDIEDQGPGFTSDPEILFEPFTKPMRFGGSGFSLPLARKQALSLQGNLQAEKLPGIGSKFTLELPVSPLEAQDLIDPDHLFTVDEEPAPALLRHSLSGKVLLVLDGQEQQRAVAYHLERLGLRTEIIASGQPALTRLREEAFPIVLWDWHKSDVAVLDAVHELRQGHYQGAILALGDQVQPAERESFMFAGGNAILNRPIVPAVWRQILAAFLASDDEAPNHASDQEEIQPTDFLQSDFRHDREFMTLVRAFVVKLPGLMAELRAALQVADLAYLIKQAHALADSARLYGYSALTEEASRLEEAILNGRDTPNIAKLLDTLEIVSQRIDRGIRLAPSNGTIALPGVLTIAA
jgi:signal transduction histidine kinase/CheY-like chemotaxis protein